MTDYEWINQYIGIPYVYNGRTKEGFDCYGLVKEIYQSQLKVVLPDWLMDNDATKEAIKSVTHSVKESIAKNYAEQIDIPDDYDIAIIRSGALNLHVGICFNGSILHVSRYTNGVVLENAMRFGRGINYYRWHRLN